MKPRLNLKLKTTADMMKTSSRIQDKRNTSSGNPDPPDIEEMARQLRRPAGPLAPGIANTMDRVNEPLYDLTVKTMRPATNDSILEIGFGSGRFFKKLFTGREGLEMSGIDYSKEMLEMARRLNKPFIQSGRLTLLQANSNSLPFKNDTFSKVFCNMVIYFWDRPGEHLNEIRRVLKAGGRFYTGFRTRESMVQLPFTRYGFKLFTRREWSTILEDHGFTLIGTCQKQDSGVVLANMEAPMVSVCVVAEKE